MISRSIVGRLISVHIRQQVINQTVERQGR